MTSIVVANNVIDSAVATNDIDPVVVLSSENNVVLNDLNQNVVTESSQPAVVLGGLQGIQGPPGESNNYVTMVAGVSLGGNRAVANSSGLAAYGNLANEHTNIIGVTTSATATGELTQVQISGFMTEPSWNFTVDAAVYVGANGVLTQTVPSSGLIQIIGYAVLANKIFINRQPPIFME